MALFRIWIIELFRVPFSLSVLVHLLGFDRAIYQTSTSVLHKYALPYSLHCASDKCASDKCASDKCASKEFAIDEEVYLKGTVDEALRGIAHRIGCAP